MSELDRFPLLYESYSKSAEQYVTAAKVPTAIAMVLWKMDGTTETERAEGKTYPVGSVIRIRGSLDWVDTAGVRHSLAGKTVDFYHRLDTGTAEKIGSKTSDASGMSSFDYAMGSGGKHTFWMQFAGDASYEGCEEGSLTFAD